MTNRAILFNSEHLIHFQEETRGFLTGNGQVPCSTRSLEQQRGIAYIFPEIQDSPFAVNHFCTKSKSTP